MYSQADTSLVSVSSSGEQGNQISWRAAISADGRFVTFDSRASNLVTGDTNGRNDLFLHDRQTGGTNRVNVDSQGNQSISDDSFGFGSSLSADGRFVGFSSRAPDLVPNDTNNSSDTFVHDTQTGETMRVSVSSAGVQGNVESSGSSLSADGRFVAFQSRSPLVANDSNSASDVFVRDRQTGETTRISLSTSGAQEDGASYGAAISGDGQFVAFASFATNLVADDTNEKVDIFVHNRQTGETSRVSVSSQALQADDESSPPLISHDGRFVAYESRATNLVLNDTNARADVFVHDRQTGETSRVSVDSSGMQGTVTGGFQPSMSTDGRYVAFATADKLVAEDQNDTIEVYLHDRQNSTTVRVSVDNLGNEGNSGSSEPAISGDGSVLAFQSTATNLVVGDTNGWSDVFVVEPPPGDEVCNNGVDDDGDGLIDAADPDCRPPSEGFFVRCMHNPVYPQLGDIVTITAETIDNNGYPVVPDFTEIYVGQMDSPFESVTDQAVLSATFEANSGQFSYGCRAGGVGSDISEAYSWRALDRKLRSVDVGAPNNPDWKAIPIIYNGKVNEKIDVVLFHDDDEYDSFSDPDFLEDVHSLINEGFFTIPWFVEFQWAFNFWIATANTANASPKPSGWCARDVPDRIEEDYAYRDAGGIVHASSCRDNANTGSKIFTVRIDMKRLQVFTHEIGHAAFGLADEYCRSNATICDGGYFESNRRFSNVFATETNCQDAAVTELRSYDASACRSIKSTDSDGNPDDKTWWIGEPDYRSGVPKIEQTGDLMQQTGGREDAEGNELDRYQVGESGSEIDRLRSQVYGVCVRDKRC